MQCSLTTFHTLSQELNTSIKKTKKSTNIKAKELVKHATANKTPKNTPDDTAGEPTSPTKKKRKKQPAENTESDSAAPHKKKRRKKSVGPHSDAAATPTPCPLEAADPAAVIEASGTDVSNWEVLHVPPELLAGLAELKYEQPTEIQVRRPRPLPLQAAGALLREGGDDEMLVKQGKGSVSGGGGGDAAGLGAVDGSRSGEKEAG